MEDIILSPDETAILHESAVGWLAANADIINDDALQKLRRAIEKLSTALVISRVVPPRRWHRGSPPNFRREPFE